MSNPAAVARARAFLAAYSLTASIARAADIAKIDRSQHYRWLKISEGYAAKFALAQERAADLLEDEAIRRATDGVLEPVFYQGYKCGAVRRYSDGLMQFLLRGFKPQKYSQKTELTGAGGGPLEIELVERLNAGRARVAAARANGQPTDGT